MQIMTKGLFGSGDILKWLGVATEKVVVICLVLRVRGDRDNQILRICTQNGG
jgi:hypothetical protein